MQSAAAVDYYQILILWNIGTCTNVYIADCSQI